MSYTCPSCNSNCITLWQKYISAPLVKITCKKCGAKLYAGGVSGFLISGLQYLALVYLAYLLFLYRDLLHAAYIALAWAFFDILHLKYAPLIISKEGASAPNKALVRDAGEKPPAPHS